METIGFIGLGTLGSRLAAHLLKDGHALSVWNRSKDKEAPLVALGATSAPTPKDAVHPLTFSILWDDASVEDTVRSEGFLERMRGGIHVSMTTIKPETAKKLAALHEAQGSTYVEAPIFGIAQAVEARQALFCMAGPADAKARVKPLLDRLGKHTYDFGDIGAGTATKLVGNFMIITGFAACREAFDALAHAGVDPKAPLEMLTTTLCATPGNQRIVAALLSGGAMPASAIPDKDLGLFESMAGKAPLAQQVHALIGKTR